MKKRQKPIEQNYLLLEIPKDLLDSFNGKHFIECKTKRFHLAMCSVEPPTEQLGKSIKIMPVPYTSIRFEDLIF